MKAFTFMSVGVLVGFACAPHAMAGEIKINAFPNGEPTRMRSSPMGPVTAAPVVVAPSPDASYFNIPQPGDSYFDVPGSETETQDIVLEAPYPEPINPEPSTPDPVIIAAPFMPQAPAPQEESLQLRMSDSLDDLIVESVPDSEAVFSAAPPPSLPEIIEPVAPAEIEVSHAEQITWDADPVSVPAYQPEAVTAPDAGVMAEWRALEGANMRQVLEQWGSKAGIKTVWADDYSFAVLKPLKVEASFEVAVQKLLDQYQNNQVRPLAKLHIDQDTREKTLVVRVEEGV